MTMTTHAAPRIFESDWNWLRISGLSGSLGLHVAAIVLLALPLAIPAWKPEPVVIATRILEQPPELPLAEVPPEPQPLPMPRRQQVLPSPRPIAIGDSAMAVPITAPDNDVAGPAMPTTITDFSPAAASNLTLAYETVIEPRYPMDARRRGEQGTVVLRVLVGRDGLPKDIDIARSSGFRPLDRAAREAVLRWRFRPVQVNGVTIEARGLVPVKFSIGNA